MFALKKIQPLMINDLRGGFNKPRLLVMQLFCKLNYKYLNTKGKYTNLSSSFWINFNQYFVFCVYKNVIILLNASLIKYLSCPKLLFYSHKSQNIFVLNKSLFRKTKSEDGEIFDGNSNINRFSFNFSSTNSVQNLWLNNGNFMEFWNCQKPARYLYIFVFKEKTKYVILNFFISIPNILIVLFITLWNIFGFLNCNNNTNFKHFLLSCFNLLLNRLVIWFGLIFVPFAYFKTFHFIWKFRKNTFSV